MHSQANTNTRTRRQPCHRLWGVLRLPFASVPKKLLEQEQTQEKGPVKSPRGGHTLGGVPDRSSVRAGLGVEARANGGHALARAALFALHEVQPRHRVFRHGRVGRTARFASHVLDDVLPEQGLDVLGHVLAPSHQPLVPVHAG